METASERKDKCLPDGQKGKVVTAGGKKNEGVNIGGGRNRKNKEKKKSSCWKRATQLGSMINSVSKLKRDALLGRMGVCSYYTAKRKRGCPHQGGGAAL